VPPGERVRVTVRLICGAAAFVPFGKAGRVDELDGFLEMYGLAAASLVMLVKAVGVPVPVPGDVILLATAARAAQGKVLLWLAFVALLAALTLGGTLQFVLARGPARLVVLRFGSRLGLSEQRLQRIGQQVQRGGLFGIALAVLTPGLRTAVVPACGVSGVPLRLFLPALALGSAIDLGLHFVIGYAGAGLLSSIVAPAPVAIVVVLAAIGAAAWLIIARKRKASAAFAASAWVQATCPACLVVGSLAPAVR
jgi:membrane protein DedA with SNARE-associated domain